MKQKRKGQKKRSGLIQTFERLCTFITHATGTPTALISVTLFIVLWACSGPLLGFSDTWQLIINTITTVITFLMVFIIQHAQNKDTMALQLKLNELITSNKNASNRLINIEDLTEEELTTIKEFYIRLSALAAKDKDLFRTHSIEEAHNRHTEKQNTQKRN